MSFPRSSIRKYVPALLMLAAVCALSLCVGAVTLSPREVVRILLSAPESSLASRLVWYARLPRMLGAVTAGAALALSGAVIQTVLNNPMAAPHIIGVNAGAGLAVTLLCAFGPLWSRALPLAAFCGALCAVFIVVTVAERTGASRLTLVLSGIMISSLFNAAIDTVVTFVPNALTGYTDFRLGGFSGLTMGRLLPAVGPVAVCAVALVTLAPQLEVLSLGQETAAGLGMAVGPMRAVFFLLSAALSGAAVSIAGLLGFVGLIVPHIARRMTGGDLRGVLAVSALGGAILTTLCDLLSRTLFLPYELPVGIVLSFVGVPFFLYQLLRRRSGRHG